MSTPFLIKALVVLAVLSAIHPAFNLSIAAELDSAARQAPEASAFDTAQSPSEIEERIEKGGYGPRADIELLNLARFYAAEKDYQKAKGALRRLIRKYPESAYLPDALYGIAFLMYKDGEFTAASGILEIAAAHPSAEAAEKSKRLIKDIDSITGWEKRTGGAAAIGALLPLEGRYSQFAEDALQGILLAAGVFDKKARPIEVRVKNDSADAAGAEAAVDGLAKDGGIAGIAGPLLSATARQAALRAEGRKVPLVALSQKEGITSAGEYVFRNSMTPREQAAAIAGYASKKLGLKSFVILHPANNYGAELAAAFRAEAARLGGKVVKEAAYQPGTRDFGSVLRETFAVQGKEKTVGRRVIKDFKTGVEADALYIPDYYETISLIAPYLGYYDIKDVALLGSNGWNSARLVELAGASIEGAVFVDGFFAGSLRPGAAEFSSGFQRAYERPPGALEAQAYDAAGILIHAAAASGAGVPLDRAVIKNRLKATKDFIGASGPVSFGPEREAQKRLFILTVKHGAIAEAED
ncbi:MAG: penicillin-binding protein activator [Deltaproteobacteria bacterium]|nr:penicillin-binding protein activator [Deltaproteobacteria bacterium]